MLKNWLKIYWYNAKRNKFYFLLNVLGLAIGLSAVIISYLYYAEEKSYDKWHPYSDRVFSIETKFSVADNDSWATLSYPYGAALMDISDEVEDYAYSDGYYQGGMLSVNGKYKSFERACYSQSDFFKIFPFEILNGNKQKPFDGPDQVLIKDTYVEYLFNDKDPIGQTIELWGKVFTVKGIYKGAETLSSMDPNMVFNNLDERVKEAIASNGWGNYSSALWLKLKTPESKGIVEKQLLDIYNEKVIAPVAKSRGISAAEFKKENGYEDLTFYLHSLSTQRLMKEAYKNATPEGIANVNRIYIALGLSVMIMLLSVFNYINITTVQVMNRGKEVGMRKTLGASRGGMMMQNYFESGLTVLISIIISFVIVEYSLPSLRVFFKAKLLFNILEYIPQVLLFLVMVVFLVGTIPALYISSFRTIEVLKGTVKRSKKGIWFKNTLLTVQFVVACFFIIGSLIVNQQVNYMLNKDLGYKADQIVGVSYNLKKDLRKNTLPIYQRLKEDILKINGVEGASAWSLAMGGKSYASVGYSYQGNQIQAGVAAMDYDFFDLFDIKLKEGRALSREFASDSINNVLLNEKAISMMGLKDPIGKSFDWNENKVTIVGVVKDFNLFGLNEDYRPMIFLSLDLEEGWGSNMSEMSIKINAENAKETMDAIEQVWKKHDISDLPFTYEFVDKRFAKSFDKTIQERNVFMVLNGLVVFIALFGLFSLASFSINSRLKEVAIRKVLGASAESLIKQLTAQYIIYCLLGFGLAVFPSYYLLNKWLSDYAFRIEIGVLPFIICFLIIVVLTLLIVFSRAYKATKINVLKYIKYE
ncbi:ABC transporter permease [Myroides marinus]|uniref:Putative ABC transport system permease protein n=1 Tax=Myroides marinus TaxID=703342 RepID=A0A1H6RL95_9FLAO|nr:ABC transporter permease [Myroides marinus]MDM1345557.1 ABC transporter permease [Myroides marinus]MDM1349146.1 ABC transporter permease [Myroides marinus]MDM1356356.1 ABC transporter permease [Myroides marinus]MDM1363411.1 ABC transporter permease [Myroides marinus]MDM1501872.1 ABC transporter permease [Myroides marinus]